MPNLQVAESEAGKRLDLYLSLLLPQFSRSQIKKAINSEEVKVNGVVEFHPQYRVKIGDEIVVEMEAEQGSDEDEILAAPVEFEVLYEDESILAINKAAGLVVHPAAGHKTDTLANGVKYYLQQKGENVWGANRAGLVHRLDAATSGVILFAKNPQALWLLSQQFAQREVKKVYLALIQGEISAAFTVTSSLGRDRVNRKKISSRTNRARHALTEFEPLVISKDKKATLLLAKPYTGRTHQIRVHLKEKNHPIVGDGIYGGVRNPRLMLHAYQLRFRPSADSAEVLTLTAHMPEDFLKSLKRYNFDLQKVKQKLKML